MNPEATLIAVLVIFAVFVPVVLAAVRLVEAYLRLRRWQ